MSRKQTDPAQRDNIGRMASRLLQPAHLASLAKRGADSLRRDGVEATWRQVSFRVDLALHRQVWQYRADIPLRRELAAQRAADTTGMPSISVVAPLYNTPEKFLRQMVESVRRQSYGRWQLVLADASDKAVQAKNQALLPRDERIVYIPLEENKGIAENTNAGLAKATGEYVTLLDHDDVLQPNALFEVAAAVRDTGAQVIYSDEIVLSGDLKELGEYHFKPDFSPDTLRGCNYITHLCAFSRALLEQVGYERPEYDGAQDFDLILRLTEAANKVHHIPKVLYFWRRHAGSTAAGIAAAKPYALEAGRRAVQAQLDRLGLAGSVEQVAGSPGAYRVRYQLTNRPLVSVLIPNKDHTDDLDRCLASLRDKGGYDRLEVIVIENNSTDPATFRYYEEMEKQYPFARMVRYEGPFNFSAINNFGRRFAKGQQLLLLNNDIELLSEDFIPELLGYSQRPDVGAVGAKLYYPDDTIQHAGVFIGLGGSAGHSHKSHPRKSGGDMYRLATTQNMSAVTGACLMVKAELYDAMGGLDEKNFAVAYNDVDFCLKLRDAGYLNVFTPFAEAYHYESKSRGSDNEGANALRYRGEKQRFVEKYAAMMGEGGDPYYNPHFTLLYENYGYK